MNNLLRRPWEGGALKDHQVAAVQARVNAFSSAYDERQVGRAHGVERGRDADEDRVACAQRVVVGGGGEVAGFHDVRNYLAWHVGDVASSSVEQRDLARVYVYAVDAPAGLGKCNGQGQPYIA